MNEKEKKYVYFDGITVDVCEFLGGEMNDDGVCRIEKDKLMEKIKKEGD